MVDTTDQLVRNVKRLYVNEILEKTAIGKNIEIMGWIRSKRVYKKVVFLDIIDSTGCVGAMVSKDTVGIDMFSKARKIRPESAIKVHGKILKGSNNKGIRILVKNMDVIGAARLNIAPRPRTDFSMFDNKYVDFVLKKKHLFLRNPKMMAIIKTKYILLRGIRDWFHERGFIEIDTPILTQATLYEDASTFKVDYFGTPVFLSQCAAFYLEAAVHAFEKVYTVAPAFRAQPSRSPRHNPEFWHVKSQIAFCDFEDAINFTEQMIYFLAQYVNRNCEKELMLLEAHVDVDGMKPPYPRITYDDALRVLETKGLKLNWGKSLGSDEERVLASGFNSPFFVKGLPRRTQPFPYRIDPSNPNVVMNADLIAPKGFGEILGVAEFIHEPTELIMRMKECDKLEEIKRYDWYIELSKYGSVPHCGFGMGVERLLRWLLELPHVRDTFLFPRLYNRIPYP